MILSLHEQARLFLLMLLLGGGMGLAYDGLRIFRHTLPHSRLWIQIEDGIFWLLTIFLVFCAMLRANGGELRFFLLLGFFGGMGLYFLLLSRPVLAVSDRLLAAVCYLVRLFFRILFTPFLLLFLPFRKPLRSLGAICVQKRKKLLHLVKLYVKIIKNRLRRDCKILWQRKGRERRRWKKEGKKEK